MRPVLPAHAVELGRIGATEVPFLAQLDVRCDPADAHRLGFPGEPNTVAGDMARGVLWLGPDEWLVVGAPGTEATTTTELHTALAGTHHSIVDVGANRTVIELTGAERHMALATGCSLDLEPAGGWSPGRCAQTLFGRAPVLLQELEAATRVFVRPSFAAYVVERLTAAVAR